MSDKDWADIEAEREVDALTPVVPPMATHRPPVTGLAPGEIITVHGTPRWVRDVSELARVLGVKVFWNESSEAFYAADPAGIRPLFTAHEWEGDREGCMRQLEPKGGGGR